MDEERLDRIEKLLERIADAIEDIADAMYESDEENSDEEKQE
ncbi:MAG: hypothetical protein PHT54_04450 [Candidatus Nanoarchaeia archaeon]|nr:hypothetical protein [Candidatus Nanoarchaeia archaeon]